VREAPEQWLCCTGGGRRSRARPGRPQPRRVSRDPQFPRRPRRSLLGEPPRRPPEGLAEGPPEKPPTGSAPERNLRDRPRAPPRPHPELDRRRRALPPRAARPAAVLPDARLEVLARPWVGELYRAVPEVDAVVGAGGTPPDFLALRGRYDLGVLLPNSFGTALVLWRRGSPNAGAMRRDGRGILLTRSCRVPAGVRGRKPGVLLSGHAGRPGPGGRGGARRVARVPRGLGGAGPSPAGGRGAWIGVNPGAFYGRRQALAARAFRRRRRTSWPATGASVAIVGGAAERPLARQIAGQLRAPCACWCGETTLGELVGLLKHLRVLLTNDSGPMHLAAALGTRSSRSSARPTGPETLARLRPGACRAEETAVRAVPPAGVPDRPPLHDPRSASFAWPPPRWSSSRREPRSGRPSSWTATARCRTRWG